MEKGNAEESVGQAAETGTTQTATGAGTGTATGTAPPSIGTQTAGGGGGGSQADQSGPQEQTQVRREVLWQGPHEAGHHDGSTLRLDGQGGATFKDGPNTARLEGDKWVDARTGEPAGRGLAAKADHRLREVEMERGLRKTMMP